MLFDSDLQPAAPRLISTPWGELRPSVDLLPVLYLLVLYGVVFFLPFDLFEAWRKGEDGPAEWLQFLGYAGAALAAFAVAWQRRRVFPALPCLAWLVLAVLCVLIAGEEISWAERLTGAGVDAIRRINDQGETTIHNIPLFQQFMHFGFIAVGLLLGYFGWRFWPRIDAFPARRFSLYFLPVALFYTYWDLSWITRGERIRNDQEAIELMLAAGLFLHAWTMARRQRRLRAVGLPASDPLPRP
ncbi:MAG: pectate lyase [Prochlorococcaceae cyanobacterium]